jgi:hypothetical protein
MRIRRAGLGPTDVPHPHTRVRPSELCETLCEVLWERMSVGRGRREGEGGRRPRTRRIDGGDDGCWTR